VQDETRLKVTLRGIAPLMFDRYAGDNNTSLAVEQKMYLDDDQHLTIPVLNIYSMLIAENTKSVAKLYYGKKWRDVAMGVAGYVSIEPYEILISDETGPIRWTGDWTDKLVVHRSVARLLKGIPNPKERPMLRLPWQISFDLTYRQNRMISETGLRRTFDEAGTIGLGTFRPQFGRFVVGEWRVQD